MGWRMDLEKATSAELEHAALEHYHAVIDLGEFAPEKARKLAGCVGALVMRGAPLPPELRQWVGCGLLAISGDGDPAAAFHLVRRQGRPPAVDWAEVALRYHALFSRGVSRSTAFAQIAADLSAEGRDVDEKSIRNSYKKNIQWFYELSKGYEDFTRQMECDEVLSVLMANNALRMQMGVFFDDRLAPGLGETDEE